MLFPTTLVGSYPQPEWLIDRAKLVAFLHDLAERQGKQRDGESGEVRP